MDRSRLLLPEEFLRGGLGGGLHTSGKQSVPQYLRRKYRRSGICSSALCMSPTSARPISRSGLAAHQYHQPPARTWASIMEPGEGVATAERSVYWAAATILRLSTCTCAIPPRPAEGCSDTGCSPAG